LFWDHPYVGIPVAIIAIGIFIYGSHTANAHRDNRVTQTIRRGLQAQNAQRKNQAISTLRSRDPGFDEDAFTERVKTAFTKLQDAWCSQDFGTAKQFMSDGLLERFSLQVADQKDEGFRDRMDGLSILDCRVAQVESGPHFDTIHVYIRAAAVDQRVELATGEVIEGSKKAEQFAEYWSFLRKPGAKTLEKPGLIEGFCPNCGSAIDIVQVNTCNACDSLLRSGQYDWVLAEITQEAEWSVQEAVSVPGMAAMRQADEGFNIQYIEDRTSVIFWRQALAAKQGSVAPLRKMALESYCESFAQDLRPAADGSRQYFGDCIVGSVETKAVAQAEDFDHVYVEVVWEGYPMKVLPDGTRLKENQARRNSRHVLSLARRHGAETDVSSSLTSAHCPGCGAPELESEAHECEYCGLVLNDGGRDWVLEDILSPAGDEVRRAMSAPVDARSPSGDGGESGVGAAGASAAGFRCGPEAAAYMAAIMLADGEIDEKEMDLLRHFAQARGVSQQQLQSIVQGVRAGQYRVSPPGTPQEAMEIVRAAAVMALVDGKVDDSEMQALQAMGSQMGLAPADIRNTVASERRRLYEQARDTLRGA